MPKYPRQRVQKHRRDGSAFKHRSPNPPDLLNDHQSENYSDIVGPKISRARKVSFDNKLLSQQPQRRNSSSSSQCLRRTRSCLHSLVSDSFSRDSKYDSKEHRSVSFPAPCLLVPLSSMSPNNDDDDHSPSSSIWGQFVDVVPPDENIPNNCVNPYKNVQRYSRFCPLTFSPYRLLRHKKTSRHSKKYHQRRLVDDKELFTKPIFQFENECCGKNSICHEEHTKKQKSSLLSSKRSSLAQIKSALNLLDLK